MNVKKSFVVLIAIFGVLLLLPFTVQTVVDFCGTSDEEADSSVSGGPRLLSFDIFKDTFYGPFKREASMVDNARKLKAAWHDARENVAAGSNEGELSQNLEPVVNALSDLESATFAVNTYAQLDTADDDYKLLRRADTLLYVLEDEPEHFPELDSCLRVITERFSDFSVLRALDGIRRYGVWKGSYLRAFEKTVENEMPWFWPFVPSTS